MYSLKMHRQLQILARICFQTTSWTLATYLLSTQSTIAVNHPAFITSSTWERRISDDNLTFYSQCNDQIVRSHDEKGSVAIKDSHSYTENDN
jgi:hypothetical protein